MNEIPVVDFVGNNKEELINNKQSAMKFLKSHGIVCMRNINFNEREFLDFTESIGSLVDLPEFMSPSKCSGYKHIDRIANFTEGSDEIDIKYAFGNHWHHDGDFWPPGEQHIINLLYSKIVAQSGGKTGFLDTQMAYLALSEDVRASLKDLTITIDPRNVEDFRDVDPSYAIAGGIGKHDVLQYDENGVGSCYFPIYDGTIGDTVKYTYEDLMMLVDKPEFKYLHEWKPNEIIVWDNLKFMHRAMGNTVGKRLLWRTQARVYWPSNK